jgi:TRAP transporter TAXI family solute receptor
MACEPDKTRRNLVKVMLAAGTGALAGCSGPSIPANLYRWGSSSLGSSGYVIIEAFSQLVNRHTNIRNASLATAGTSENMFLIGEGKLDLGHSTSVDWMPALAGRKPYTRPVRAMQLFAYAVWHQLPIVRADSGILELSDLAGRRFSPSQPGSGTAAMYKVLLQSAELYDRIRLRYGSWSEVYTAFRAGQIDSVVGMLTNGMRSSWVQQLEATIPIRALRIPAAVLLKARAVNPGILDGQLDGRDWSAIDRTMRVPAIAGIVACGTRVSAEIGYAVTAAILDRAAELKRSARALNVLDVEFAVRNLMISAPVNAGAAQYFIEKGVWRNELTIAA